MQVDGFVPQSHPGLIIDIIQITGPGEHRVAQEVAVLARARVPDLDVLLRGLRVHDDAALRGRHPHAVHGAAVHAAHQAAVLLALLPERPDQQADGADVPLAGYLFGSAPAVR